MLKENINRLDRELKEVFDVVKISETEDKSKFFFDILAEKKQAGKLISVRLLVEKRELEKSLVSWKYFSNTSDETSHLVECVSLFDSLSKDIHNVVASEKFDSAYLESLQSVDDVVIEDYVEIKEDLVGLMEQFGVEHLETHTTVEDNVYTSLGYFKHNLRKSDMQRVEMALEAAGYPSFFWNDDKLLVKYYN